MTAFYLYLQCQITYYKDHRTTSSAQVLFPVGVFACVAERSHSHLCLDERVVKEHGEVERRQERTVCKSNACLP